MSNCRIVNQRGAKGRFLPKGEVSPAILERIAHAEEIKTNAKRPLKTFVPEHKRDLTHNPFAALLAK